MDQDSGGLSNHSVMLQFLQQRPLAFRSRRFLYQSSVEWPRRETTGTASTFQQLRFWGVSYQAHFVSCFGRPCRPWRHGTNGVEEHLSVWDQTPLSVTDTVKAGTKICQAGCSAWCSLRMPSVVPSCLPLLKMTRYSPFIRG